MCVLLKHFLRSAFLCPYKEIKYHNKLFIFLSFFKRIINMSRLTLMFFTAMVIVVLYVTCVNSVETDPETTTAVTDTTKEAETTNQAPATNPTMEDLTTENTTSSTPNPNGCNLLQASVLMLTVGTLLSLSYL